MTTYTQLDHPKLRGLGLRDCKLPQPGFGPTARAAQTAIEKYSTMISAICDEKKAQAKLVEHCKSTMPPTCK